MVKGFLEVQSASCSSKPGPKPSLMTFERDPPFQWRAPNLIDAYKPKHLKVHQMFLVFVRGPDFRLKPTVDPAGTFPTWCILPREVRT